MKPKISKTVVTVAAIFALLPDSANACTGITLKSKDGAVVFGRTLEWGSFDLRSRLVVVPRGYEYQSELPGGKHGLTWTTKYGAVGLDVVGKDFVVDGMNEKGLCVNVFYHPGSAQYPAFDPAKSATTMGSLDVCQYLLTTCSSIEEVRAALTEIVVVGVNEPAIGIAPPIHLIATEPGGNAIWTTGYDSKNLMMQYHTQHNRRVRQVDLKNLDFAQDGGLQRLPLDQDMSQDILDVTPVK